MAKTDYECANIYTAPPLEPITVEDADMTTGSPVLECLTSTPFTAEMVGRYVIIEGAGASGETYSGKIITFTDSGEVELDTNAGTTVSGASGRINLQVLTHRNGFTNPADTVNDALKSEDHTDFAANINDPAWDRSGGYACLGSKNLLILPFGFYASDKTTYVALNQLTPGRPLFTRFVFARKNSYVKIKGRLFCGIYNNDPFVLDFIKGGQFSLSASLAGNTDVSTVSTEYKVVLQTQQGFYVVSDTVTVANAPDDNGFDQGGRVRLTWEYFAGTINALIYRKRSGENVFLLESYGTGSNQYTDTNNPLRSDTGSVSYPAFANPEQFIRSYFAFTENLSVKIDGIDSEWSESELYLPFTQTVDMSQVFDPQFVIGLTEPLATELTDVVTNSTDTVTSVAGIFNASDFDGKNFTLSNPELETEITGTVTYVDANTLTLSTAATWTAASGNILEIEDSQSNGLFFDKIGVAFNQGAWDFNPEDNSDQRGQPVASTPTGSNQGGGINPGGTGGPCFVGDTLVWTPDGDIPIEEFAGRLKRGIDNIYSFNYLTGEIIEDNVDAVSAHWVNELLDVEFEAGILQPTPNHNFLKQFAVWKQIGSYRKNDTTKAFVDRWTDETIKAIKRKQTEEQVLVHNLSVRKNHTYFVVINGIRIAVSNRKIDEPFLF